MKFLAWVAVVTLLAVPLYAQDDIDGGFGGDDFFTGDLGGFESAQPEIDPLVDVRNWLAKSNASPLDKNQEKSLKKLYEKEVKAMAKSFEQQFGVSLETVMQSSRGRRAGFGRTSTVETDEIGRLSQQLVDKIIAALRIDQQAALRKFQSEERSSARLNLVMSNIARAGTSLTEIQLPQVKALFEREIRLRTLMIIEAKGEPYQSKVALLETQTAQRLVNILDQSQKTALTEAAAKAKALRESAQTSRRALTESN